MRVQRFKRGQIWWYETGTNYNGSIQGKTRPVIIMSNDLANANSNCLLAIPCTTADKKPMPTHTNFEIDGNANTALAENMLSVNINRLTDYVGIVDDDLLHRLEYNIAVALGLPLEIFSKKPVTALEKEIEEKQPVIPTFIDDSPLEEKLSTRKAYNGVGRKGYQKYTKEQMLRFINDCENHTIEWVTKKYNCSSEKATSNKLYRFRKFLKENP